MPPGQTIKPDTDPRPRVLITGGAGFIGSHLLDLLAPSGAQITVVDDLSTGRVENIAHHQPRIRFIGSRLDRALEQLEDEPPFDRVYHLAAAVGVDLILADPIGSIETNVEQTSALLRYVNAHGNPPTLIASSSEVYGKPGASVFSEDDDTLYGPSTTGRWSYAHCKAIDEHLALAYHDKRGLPAVVCRFFNTVGPRQSGQYGMVLPRFVQAALNDAPIRVFGDGEQTRCFCDVRDVVAVLPTLLESSEAHGRVFNIGSDRPISIGQLAGLVVRELSSESPIVKTPYADAYPQGFEDLRHRRPDLSRVRSVCGFEPSYTLSRTIADIAEEIRSSGIHAGGKR
ncbi:MAG: NAD-dependent epimerase/dehydratase family protein [Phycisphaerales bacterium]|nr:NAD-dependent epimerase/dehydratase family protein [Phycisphaerales bacterium]